MYSCSYTIYAPLMGAYTKSIFESNQLVLKIYVNFYGFFQFVCLHQAFKGQTTLQPLFHEQGLSQKIDCPLCTLPRGLFFCVCQYECHSMRACCSMCAYDIKVQTSHSIASDMWSSAKGVYAHFSLPCMSATNNRLQTYRAQASALEQHCRLSDMAQLDCTQ